MLKNSRPTYGAEHRGQQEEAQPAEVLAHTAGKLAVADGRPPPAGRFVVAAGDPWESIAATMVWLPNREWVLLVELGPCLRGLVLLVWLGMGTGRGTADSVQSKIKFNQ